jgi:hypothetical protein
MKKPFRPELPTPADPKDPIAKIKIVDLTPRDLPEGGTLLVLQVNAKDDRADPASPSYGALVPAEAQAIEEQSSGFMDGIYRRLDASQRESVEVIVFASKAPLITPNGQNSQHSRTYESAERIIAGIQASMVRQGLDGSQLLNAEGKPEAESGLNDLTCKNQEFVEHLVTKYGPKKFWAVLEDDTEAKTRARLGAEGPNGIARRMNAALKKMVLGFAATYHKENPGKRLIVWAVGTYDTISPWVKGAVIGHKPAVLWVPAEKKGGIVIEVAPDLRSAKTQLGENSFSIPMLLRDKARCYGQPDQPTR